MKSLKKLFFKYSLAIVLCFSFFSLYAEENTRTQSSIIIQESIAQSVSSENKKISGTVLDKAGESIIGASVKVQGTTNGSLTDLDGKFSLTNVPEHSKLEVSYVGYITQTIPTAGKASFSIVLEEDVQTLGEVVVVGYGVQKKENLTGSVAALSNKDLDGIPATNVASMIQGKLPGVSITQTSGQPGREGSSIIIRGVGTMNNSSPMVIVDGLEGTLNDVNPNDIENLSVLKDAAASSIYGTRAANGVILITTKRGVSGKPKVAYNAYLGWQSAIGKMKQLSSADYATLINEGRRNEGLPEVYTAEEIGKYRDGSDPDNYPNTDWLDLLLQGSGFTHNHNLSINGGSESTKYAISLGYYDQEELVKHTNYERYNLRINIDNEITKQLNIGFNVSASHRKINEPTNPYAGGIDQFFRQANRIPNTYVNQYSDGTYGRHIDGNPIAWVNAGGKAKSAYSHAVGNVFGEYKIIDGLSVRGSMGIDYNLDDGKTHKKEVVYGDGTIQGPNSVEDYLRRWHTVILQLLTTYTKSFGKHNINALYGMSRESFADKTTKAFRKDFPSNDLTELNGGSTDGMTNGGSRLDSKLGSYFGRINYDYAGKYLFEANLRTDGSSKFAKGERWGIFPSFSAGWRISEENFMKDISWINNLKIRGSWGKLGNHRIEDYQYISLIALGQNYNFNDVVANGAAQTKANNPNLTWETTKELDLGLDFMIFNDLFSAEFDYYDRYTSDILAKVPVSYIYGLDAPLTNAGAMRNRGVEVSLGHSNKVGNVGYTINGNIAFNKNKVEKYPNPEKGSKIRMEGYAWDSFYGYEVEGIFMSDEEAKNSPRHSDFSKAGDLKFKDQNGDKIINSEDRVILGNTIPKITYGFNLGGNYKNFDLLASFQGAAKVNRTIHREPMWGFIDGANGQQRHLDRTLVDIEKGVVTHLGKYPRLLATQSHNREMSSFLVLNSSYLRLKNIQIGYNLPKHALNFLKIERARVYFSGQNLLTFTSMDKDFDPEAPDGSSNYSYPQVAIYTFGIDLTF